MAFIFFRIGYDAAGKPEPPWTCPAMYQRNACGDYLCDQGTFQCREAGPGEVGTMTKDECDASCKPVDNKAYICNQQSFTCEVAPDGTAGATSGCGNVLCARFYTETRNICQDRLGTNIGKVE